MMKQIGVIVLGIFFVFILFLTGAWLLQGDTIAQWAWQHGHPEIALAFDRTNAALAMQIGMAEFGGNGYNLSVALPAFEKAVAIEPGVLWGHYEIARILFVDDKLPQALAQANLELQYNPENLRTLYIRALIEGYRDDYTNAESDLRRFVGWAPTEWAGYNDLGWILLQEGKYSEAVQDMQSAFSSATGAHTNPWLWNTLGVAQLDLEDYPDALASFEQAQTLAAAMTTAQWQQAYPGDAPASDQGGLAAFRAAISQNIAKAQANIQ